MFSIFHRSSRTTLQCKKRRKLLLESLEARRVLASMPIISEFLAANSDGLRDADGDSSDWIEIYNPTSASVNLAGWRLTDDPGDLNAWTFPSVEISPFSHLLVYASGKNRATAGQELHTNFRLSSDGEFLGLVTPTGIFTSQFAPSYPIQATNVSYGTRFENQILVNASSSARTLIPTNVRWAVHGYLRALTIRYGSQRRLVSALELLNRDSM